jgi:uncharacterized protein
MSTQKRFIAEEAAQVILENGSHGILCTASPDGEPYGVPVNYCYAKEENCVYFHCAIAGRKLDNIRANRKVSFVVVGFEDVIPQKTTTYYESVMVFGEAQIVSDEKEKTDKLIALCQKYGTDGQITQAAIAKYLPATAVIKIQIQKITGKRNKG